MHRCLLDFAMDFPGISFLLSWKRNRCIVLDLWICIIKISDHQIILKVLPDFFGEDALFSKQTSTIIWGTWLCHRVFYYHV